MICDFAGEIALVEGEIVGDPYARLAINCIVPPPAGSIVTYLKPLSFVENSARTPLKLVLTQEIG